MAYPTFAKPSALSRRGFLQGTAASAAAMMALPAFAQAKGELLLWLPGGSDVFCKVQTGLLADWSAKNGGLGPSTTICGLGQDTAYSQALIGAITAGASPDIALLWDAPVSLGTQGAFLALDEMMAKSKISIDTWPGGLLASCQFKGQTFGLPAMAGLYSMWYNADMFDAKGIPSDPASFPKTWAEMRALSKEFTVWDGDDLKVAGFMPHREVESLAIWSALNGGTLYDSANFKYTIDSELNIEMFNFFIDWLDEEYKGDVNLVDRSGAFGSGYANGDTGQPSAFREGRLAGLHSGSWLMGDIWDPAPTFSNWQLAVNPVGPSGTTTVSGVWPNWLVIPATALNPQEAFDYLTFLSTEGALAWFDAVPDIPTNTLVTVPSPKILIEKRGEEFAKNAAAFYSAQAKIVTPMWDSPVQGFGNDQIRLAMEKIYTKAATPKDALAVAQVASQAELDRVLAG
ncbi:MAG: extracellular solute-binding protein [Alphaproteobacteria bacterium]